MGSYGPSPLEALQRGLQIKAFLEDRKYREQARQQQREQYMLEMEDRRRQRVLDDFKTTVLLNQMGAAPVEQGVVGDFRAGLGGRGAIDTPVGRYSMPTQEQRAAQTGKLKGLEQNALEQETDPYTEVDLGPELGGKTQVPKRSVADVKIRAYEKTHPNLTRETLGPNDAGDYTIILRDPRTQQEVYRQTEKGAGRTARTSADKPDYEADVLAEGDRSAERIKRMDDMRESVYQRLGIPNDDSAMPEDRTRAEKHLGDVVDEAMDADFKRAVAKRKVAGRRGASSGGPVMPAKNVALAARRKRMTVAQFKQWFAQQGGTIQ